MHLLYVDESGDTGHAGSQTRTFTLSGLLVHHAEIHASEMLGRSEAHHGTQRHQRIQAALHAVEMIRREKRLTPLRVIVAKGAIGHGVPQAAWLALLEATSRHIASGEGHQFCSAQGLAVVCDDHRTAPSAAWLSEIRAKLDL